MVICKYIHACMHAYVPMHFSHGELWFHWFFSCIIIFQLGCPWSNPDSAFEELQCGICQIFWIRSQNMLKPCRTNYARLGQSQNGTSFDFQNQSSALFLLVSANWWEPWISSNQKKDSIWQYNYSKPKFDCFRISGSLDFWRQNPTSLQKGDGKGISTDFHWFPWCPPGLDGSAVAVAATPKCHSPVPPLE
jgi:hypothetical protein